MQFARKLTALVSALFIATAISNASAQEPSLDSAAVIRLPTPRLTGETSVERALNERRSVRDFSAEPISLMDISQLLWAAQGITKAIETPPAYWRGDEWMGGLRTAPSAGGLYPIELYIAAGNIPDLNPGLYRYIPQNHGLKKILDGDQRSAISEAALNQKSIQKCAAVIAICANPRRTAFKYSDRADMYVKIEVGAVCQNIYVQSVALNTGTVFIGAFHDDAMKVALHLPEGEIPLGIMPIGRKLAPR